MALEHAILVSLLEQPGSGYELARRFDRSIGFFWAASHQQIYRVLKRMVDDGWVRADEVAQDGRPDKKVYEATDAGRAELAAWLRTPGEPESIRSELGVKLRGAAFDDPAVLLTELAAHRKAHAERLALYEEIERRDFGDAAGRAARLQHAVLRAGIRFERGWLDWCDETITVIADGADGRERTSPEQQGDSA